MTGSAFPVVEYTAHTLSPLINGEVRITISENALSVVSPEDTEEIPFSEINMMFIADYAVAVKSDVGNYIFSHMGNRCQPFFDALCEAYNKAVLRALSVKERLLLSSRGDYRFSESGAAISGQAVIQVYKDSVITLSPDLNTRRVPLCLVSSVEKSEFALTLNLDTGESYVYSKLGADVAPLTQAVETQLRAMREASLSALKEIDRSLTATQAAQLVKRMPQGSAASFGQLAAIAPSFVSALAAKLSLTRASESYKALAEICDPARIFVGFRKNEASDSGVADVSRLLSALSGLGAGAGNEPYQFWLAAPSPDGRYALVDFAESDSAVYVYRAQGGFDGFVRQLSRALEAADFRREVFRLSDEELRNTENAGLYMTVRRTCALQFVRACFAGRVVRSESWKQGLAELWG